MRALAALFGGGGSVAWLVLAMGILLTLLGVLTAIESLFQIGLRVTLSSGDAFIIWKFDSGAVRSMHTAVERAITFNAHPSGQPLSVAGELGRLSALRDRGALSPQEWDSAKALFLGKQPDAQQQAIDQLHSLHGLLRSGVLSESEFNMKKWDILASSPGTF